MQGVGECIAPLRRLPSNICAVTSRCTDAQDANCAIHQHFMDGRHTPQDLRVMLVDAIPRTLIAHPAVFPALRKRLEWLWIHKLDAKLNVKRYLHNSVTGDLAARQAPAAE